MTTQHYTTTNPYESTFGYSRGTKRGPFIFISGTTSISPSTGELLHPNSHYLQACQIFDEIIRSVVALGGGRMDIVRVRMFVAGGDKAKSKDSDSSDKDEDYSPGSEVGKALKEKLGEDVKPAATMIMGCRFVDERMLVEIEADAVVLV